MSFLRPVDLNLDFCINTSSDSDFDTASDYDSDTSDIKGASALESSSTGPNGKPAGRPPPLTPLHQSGLDTYFAYSGRPPPLSADINEIHFYQHHYTWMRLAGPDYDELIVPLSLYAFDRLSPDDQLEHLNEIRSGQNVNAEEIDFRELFKKLKYLDQLGFLSRVLNLFKCGRFIPSFKQLDADHQQQVIDQIKKKGGFDPIAWVTQEILRNPEETEEDYRLREFIQLCKSGRTRNVEKLLAPKKHGDDQQEEKEHISDWKSGFSELFLGFSFIWFQGQWAIGQDFLIEQLSKGGLIKIEKDSKIATFTELCKKVVDFRVQERVLDDALEKLQRWGYDMKILEPQDHDGAAELLSDLSTIGFGLMSAEYQHHKIEELSNKALSNTVGELYGLPHFTKWLTLKKQERHIDLSEEAIRMRRFRELLDQVSVPTRIDEFNELREVLLKHRRYSEAVDFFSGLGPEDQTEIIEKLVHEVGDSSEPVIEKTYGESEEDLRSRRFKNVCTRHLSTWNYIVWSQADKERVRQRTSDHKEEESPYAEFLFDTSVTWFKARCTNYHRNPIQVLISGEVEVTEKLPEESEEGFRFRRFAESFKKLEFTSKESIFNHIQSTLFHDLGYSAPTDVVVFESYEPPAVGRDLFDSEWIKMKLPNLQGQGAGAPTAQVVSAAGSATTTQAGEIVVRK